MNLHTTYMGLQLRSPLVIGAAAPLSEDIDNIKRMEDFGAAAVVLHSFSRSRLNTKDWLYTIILPTEPRVLRKL